jgi:hypothetical protein
MFDQSDERISTKNRCGWTIFVRSDHQLRLLGRVIAAQKTTVCHPSRNSARADCGTKPKAFMAQDVRSNRRAVSAKLVSRGTSWFRWEIKLRPARQIPATRRGRRGEPLAKVCRSNPGAGRLRNEARTRCGARCSIESTSRFHQIRLRSDELVRLVVSICDRLVRSPPSTRGGREEPFAKASRPNFGAGRLRNKAKTRYDTRRSIESTSRFCRIRPRLAEPVRLGLSRGVLLARSIALKKATRASGAVCESKPTGFRKSLL